MFYFEMNLFLLSLGDCELGARQQALVGVVHLAPCAPSHPASVCAQHFALLATLRICLFVG